MTDELLALGDWLADQHVTHVAMESTGVYWKPLWNLLEERFQLVLVNAQHVKQVPGRKTDVKDCEWLAAASSAYGLRYTNGACRRVASFSSATDQLGASASGSCVGESAPPWAAAGQFRAEPPCA